MATSERTDTLDPVRGPPRVDEIIIVGFNLQRSQNKPDDPIRRLVVPPFLR